MTDQLPLAVDVFVDEKAPAAQETPLVDALITFGCTVRVRAVPAQRVAEQFAWVVLIALPLHAFLSGLGGKFAEDAHRKLREAVAKALRREPEQPAERVRPVVLQDAATGLQVVLGPQVDEDAYRKLLALDLTQYRYGPVRYDATEARWVSDVDEAMER